MDKNTITGIILILAIFIGFTYLNQPSPEEIAKGKRKHDSIAKIKHRNDSLQALQLQTAAQEHNKPKTPIRLNPNDSSFDSTALQQLENKYGVFAKSSREASEEKKYHLKSKKLDLTISTLGGKICEINLPEFHTYDSLPLILFDTNSVHFNLAFFLNNRLFNSEDFNFKAFVNGQAATSETIELQGEESLTFSMRLYPDQSTDSYIEYAYIIKDDYLLDFNIRFTNMDAYIDKRTSSMDLNWNAELLLLEKSVDRFNGPTIYYKYAQDNEVDYLTETKNDEEDLSTKVKWISFKHRFFSSVLIAENNFTMAKVKAFVKENPTDSKYVRSMEANITLPYSTEIPMHFYFGPNKYDILKSYDQDFERQIPLGWSFFIMSWINRYIVIYVFNFFEGFNWNYGIIILVLTVLLKLFLFPLTYKSYLSSAKMRVLKPDIDKLAEKYPKKEDAMKKQQATMALYKKAGVNPMAGCVPMLLQMPILFAMFRFFPSAFELRQQAFLWAEDLSAYDVLFHLPVNIPFVGEHISGFTLLMTISTILYTRMNQNMMASNQTMPGMKTIMYLMPIMFFGIFNGYASALSYYYFLANMITFGQMYLIRRYIDEDKIRKKLEANKKRVVKKSKWQQRLEEAQKKRDSLRK
jgi:YidC/Oxa1 family membrane protein insertase